MELHELRRRWQQQPALSQALEQQELDAILARQSDSIVERLRRNARLELYVNFGVLLGSLTLAWLAQPFWLRVFGWVLVVVGGVCIVYLQRKLHLLRRMDDPAGDLRAHLLRLASGLRTLIRFYFRFTMAMLPVTGFVQVLMVVSTAKRGISLSSLPGLALLVGLVVVLPALLYLPVASLTRLYLQRLYGQHLDRLEEYLSELQSS